MQHGGGGVISAVCTDADDVVTRFQNICTRAFIVGGHASNVKAARYGFTFSGGQLTGFGERAKLLLGLVELARGLAQVHLHDLPSGCVADIFNVRAHSYLCAIYFDRGRTHAEIRVGKSVAKGEQRLFAKGIKVTVADIDALAVAGIVPILKIGHFGVILKRGPGGRQLAGGVRLAQQNVRQCAACLDAELRQQQNIAH